MIMYSNWKPVGFLTCSQGCFRLVSSKEKMVYLELTKLITERDKDYAEEIRSMGYPDHEATAGLWRIVYRDGTIEYIGTSRLLYNFSKSKVGKLHKEVSYVLREPPKRVLNAERSRRVKIDAYRAAEMWPDLWTRAELYGRKLNEELPEASSKYISDAEELAFLAELAPEALCRYQSMRVYWVIRCLHGKTLDLFDCLWDFDDADQLWLLALRIFALDDDKQLMFGLIM